MADLGYTDAQWEQEFFDKLFLGLREALYSLELRDRYRDERTQVYDFDPNGNTDTTGLTLSGVKYGTNTAESGQLFVRITGGPTFTVSLYTATGASGLVAQGTGTASSTVTLAEQNSSGLTGTYDLAGSVTTETDDAHFLRPYLDWRLDGTAMFDRSADTIAGDDTKSLDSWKEMCKAKARLHEQSLARSVDFLNDLLISDPDAGNPVAMGAEILQSDETSILSETPRDSSGAITQLRRGIIEDLRQAMEDETTGSTQTIVERVMSATAGTAGTANDGQGAIASHTPEEQCPTGTFTLRCVRGLGTGDGGSEEFEVSFVSDDGSERRLTLSEPLTVKKQYSGEFGFGGSGGISLTRTRTKTGDGSNVQLAAATAASETGESEANTTSGVLHWRIVDAGGSTFHVEFYLSAAGATAQTPGDLMARTDVAVAAATAFTATERNSSGLEIDWTTGSAPTDTTTGTLDLNYFSIENSAGKPDDFRITVSETSSGRIQRLVSRFEVFAYRLHSTTSGGELLSDDRITPNTWEPYAVEVN